MLSCMELGVVAVLSVSLGGWIDAAGMTKSGKQKTPEWLQKALGVEVPETEGEGKTLADLLGPVGE